MKRYRLLSSDIDIDSRPAILKMEIEPIQKEAIQQQLLQEYGVYAAETKLQNFINLDSKPLSIVAFHNKFLNQIRVSFVMGAYYPALTAACSLGERILNHLILLLRQDFIGTPEYKKVYRKASFDNWALAIDTLEGWNVLLPNAVNHFRTLSQVRNRAIHFNPETDHNDRPLALEAISLLNLIIAEQFSAFGSQLWFIPIPGESYLKKEAEQNPFIKKVYIPQCHLVSPFHRLEWVNHRFIVQDDIEYEDREISDEEFVELRQRNAAN